MHSRAERLAEAANVHRYIHRPISAFSKPRFLSSRARARGYRKRKAAFVSSALAGCPTNDCAWSHHKAVLPCRWYGARWAAFRRTSITRAEWPA
jgi:hypothetical protein